MSLARALAAAWSVALLAFAPCGPAAQAAAPSGRAAGEEYSAATLYNTANAEARDGKWGLAVLNYERAGLLAPNDADIRANLRFVRESAGLPLESGNWFDRAARVASPNALSWLGLAGLLATGTALLAGRRYPTHRLKLRAAAVAGISLIGLTICNALAIWPTLHEAVIVAHGATAHVAPTAGAEALFSLPEAQIVAMGAEHADFVLVRSADGRTGWVSRADLAIVVP
jgi:hypothetical protein